MPGAPNVSGGTFNELPIAVTASKEIFGKESDYFGGIVQKEDLTGKHEKEGISEGMREKLKENRVEEAAQ